MSRERRRSLKLIPALFEKNTVLRVRTKFNIIPVDLLRSSTFQRERSKSLPLAHSHNGDDVITISALASRFAISYTFLFLKLNNITVEKYIE